MQQRLKRQTPALLLENTLTVLGQTGTACRSSTFQQTESNRPKQRVMLLRGADVFPFAEGITYSTGINQNVPTRTGCVATTSRRKM